MKIATYNMQHNKRGTSNWSKTLGDIDPDILLAQESLAPVEYHKPLLDDDWHKNAFWSLVADAWGSAVYVKSGSANLLSLLRFRGWVVGVEIAGSPLQVSEGQHSSLRVFSVHVPKVDNSYHTSLNQILDMIEEYRGDGDVVIGGDFNMTISKRHESEDRKTEAADRKIQHRLRDEFGLVNCWQAKHADSPLAQTLRWDRDPKPSYHCDGVFVPTAWAGELVFCEVLADDEWSKISDHNPVVTEFA